MNLTISGHHLEVTPALREYVIAKLDRITRHFDQVVDVKVLLTVDNMKEKQRRQRAECNVHVKGRDLFAESSHADLYAAVDDLADKLDRQVSKYKTRIQDHSQSAIKREGGLVDDVPMVTSVEDSLSSRPRESALTSN